MKKFEGLGRVMSKEDQKTIFGGPGGGTCCGYVECRGNPETGNILYGVVCGMSNQPDTWLGICHFQGYGGATHTVWAGCGCDSCGV
jgi:hypothetical protein